MGLQYGIKEVLNLNISNYATKKPFIYADYAEITTNEVTGQRLDLRGGQGSPKQMSFDHSKDSTLKITLPLVDLKMITLITGEELVTGAADVFKREVLTVDASNEINLSAVPVEGTFFLFELDGIRDYGKELTAGDNTPEPNEYVLDGQKVTLNSTTHKKGSQLVATYMHASPATSKKISIKANKFPQAVVIDGIGLARNQEDERDYPVHVHAYKARPQQGFTFTMEGSNATKLELTFDLYAVTNAAGDQQYIDYIFE